MKQYRNTLIRLNNICRLTILSISTFSFGCSPRITPPADLAIDHLLQGDADRHKNNYPAALQEYQKAVALDPNDWPAHSGAGQILEQEGDFQAAIVHYREVIAINHELRNPAEKAWWHFRLAHALSSTGSHQDAAREYKLAYKIASQDQRHSKKLAALAKQALSLSQSN